MCVRLQGIASGWPLVSAPRPAMVVCLAVAVPGCQCLLGESDPSRAAGGQVHAQSDSPAAPQAGNQAQEAHTTVSPPPSLICGLDATGYTKIRGR